MQLGFVVVFVFFEFTSTYYFLGRFCLYLGNPFTSVGGICMSFSPGICLGGVHEDIFSPMDESNFSLDCVSVSPRTSVTS